MFIHLRYIVTLRYNILKNSSYWLVRHSGMTFTSAKLSYVEPG